jgi:hypothetical protein
MELGTGPDRHRKSRLTGIRSPDCAVGSEQLYRLRYPGRPGSQKKQKAGEIT